MRRLGSVDILPDEAGLRSAGVSPAPFPQAIFHQNRWPEAGATKPSWLVGNLHFPVVRGILRYQHSQTPTNQREAGADGIAGRGVTHLLPLPNSFLHVAPVLKS